MIRVSTSIAALCLLAACTATPASPRGGPRPLDANDHRLAVMRDEPLVARDPGLAIAAIEPGHRITISAKLYDEEAQNAAEVARKQTSDTMIALRENGWMIYFAACQPSTWAYTVYAYKIVDAVSYGAVLDASATGNRARLDLRLLAPHAAEPRADVFADRPPALEPGKSCIEASSPPDTKQETGKFVVMAKTPPTQPDGTLR